PLVKWMMEVDGEVEQPDGLQHPPDLLDDAPRTLRMVDDIVAHHDVEAGVFKRQVLAERRHRPRHSLPRGEQSAIVIGKGIHAYPVRGLEVEDQAVRARSDLEHPGFTGKRPDRGELLSDRDRTLDHPGDDLGFVAAHAFGLAAL